MNRTHIIQKIINTKRATRYLEIGVNYGVNFFEIHAKHKTAVDPRFMFGWKHRVRRMFSNTSNIRAQFHQCTSDAFFKSLDPSLQFDVVFIDGLHTCEQVYRDILNSVKHLAANGVILLHDCNPTDAASAHPATSYEDALRNPLTKEWNGEWCGDVWKAICLIRSQHPELSAFVFDCDFGIGVVTPKPTPRKLELRRDEIQNMGYANLEANRQDLLDLRPESALTPFLKNLEVFGATS